MSRHQIYSGYFYPNSYHRLSARYPCEYRPTLKSNTLNGFFFQVSTLGFLLCDHFIFVGMITPQHSPLREGVIALMSSVIFCRFAQFAASFFRSDNLVRDGKAPSNNEANTLANYKDVAFVAGQIASLSFGIEIIMQLSNTSAFLPALNTSEASTPMYIIYATFMAFMIAFEVARHSLSFAHVLNSLTEDSFIFWFKILYMIECLVRLSFVFATISVCTNHLSAENQNLANFLNS